MSDQDTIFNSEETPKASEDQSEAQEQSAKFSEADPLNEYVGEGKKFDNLEKLAKGYKDSQEFIETLKSENKEIREQLEKVRELEEMVEELKNAKASEPEPQQKAAIDPSEIESIVKSTLSKAEQAKLMELNTQQVVNTLTEQFGSKAEETYNSVAKANGLSVAELNRLASTSPQAVLNLVKTTVPKASTPATSTGNINTETLQPKGQAPVSAKVANGASTKDMISAWRAAAPTNE